MTLSTEQLFTSPAGFGIRTATPAQRAACRILDGRPLGELAGDHDVLALVGGTEALAALPSERGVQPSEAVMLASVRSAKTILACAAAVRATQTVDVSRLGPGEVPRVSLVSLKLDTSAVAFRLLHDTIKASKALRPLLLEATADSLLVKHPSGRPIEIACVAGAKAGAGLVARWSAGVVFDEAPRMSSSADAVVSLADARTAILGRLLPGAQALYIGSPWAPHGDVYDLVQAFWQKPTDHFVVLRGTGPMLNPVWWTPERCAALEARDPVAYRTDVLGEFADPESGLLNPLAVLRSTREHPLELPPSHCRSYFAAVDPSEGGAGGNGFSLVIVGAEPMNIEACETPRNRYRVSALREYRGMSPLACWKEISAVCRAYGVTQCRTDQYAASANADLARMCGLHLIVDKASATSKLEDFTNLATLIHSDRIELSPDQTLRRDLLSTKKRITQAGATIILPRTSDGRHADYASALCAAVKGADSALARIDLSRVGTEEWDDENDELKSAFWRGARAG
ncbi:MAG: hypothetical protein RL385_5700, partial [Pseudomonadota bacterium]